MPAAGPPQWRPRAAEFARPTNTSVAKVAGDPGKFESWLHRWMTIDNVRPQGGHTSDEWKEFVELRAGPGCQRWNEILQRANAYLARECPFRMTVRLV